MFSLLLLLLSSNVAWFNIFDGFVYKLSLLESHNFTINQQINQYSHNKRIDIAFMGWTKWRRPPPHSPEETNVNRTTHSHHYEMQITPNMTKLLISGDHSRRCLKLKVKRDDAEMFFFLFSDLNIKYTHTHSRQVLALLSAILDSISVHWWQLCMWMWQWLSSPHTHTLYNLPNSPSVFDAVAFGVCIDTEFPSSVFFSLRFRIYFLLINTFLVCTKLKKRISSLTVALCCYLTVSCVGLTITVDYYHWHTFIAHWLTACA